ncbi:MAG TPA: ribonuclease R, partial [Candidatus Eisenbacteria bacterium]|nr:ribonuclease R [Candidatus Eisenbacteria bacterium]
MPPSNQACEKILEVFAKKPRLRLAPSEIARKAGFSRDELQRVVECLRDLARDGRVVRLKKNRYALPDAQNLITGRVHAHRDGYGFLIPESKSAPDVYLSRREMRRVLHGDRVMVRVERKARGATEARIVRIIERGIKQLVGTYAEADRQAYVVPMDQRIAPAIRLNAGSVRPEKGTVVAAEITRYASAMTPPEARLVRVIGNADDPEVQAQSIVFRYGLPASFPPEVERELLSCPLVIEPKELTARKDLRGLPIVTIDGERARDFDDAVYARRNGNVYELLVSIADVAYYVKPRDPLDREAYLRGTSVYFPDRAIPMLPEALSNGICSLNPDEDRLTKTVSLKINPKGEVIGSSFYDSVIRSRARMTYTDVRRILVDRDPECLERYRDLVDMFKLMEELALLLYEQRKRRGSLDFDLPEAEIILDLQGVPENIVRAERSIAHRLIEEFMIAANEAVARRLKEKNLPFLYRVHEGPDLESLQAIAPLLLSLGYRLPARRDDITPLEIQRILASCRGKPEEKVVNHVLLRAMKQARYQPENIGHFGLASGCYTHFTSPIRRYPDLTVHRVLDTALRETKFSPSEREELMGYLEEAGKQASDRERLAMDAEREMV